LGGKYERETVAIKDGLTRKRSGQRAESGERRRGAEFKRGVSRIVESNQRGDDCSEHGPDRNQLGDDYY
jgi:hypothetical protein